MDSAPIVYDYLKTEKEKIIKFDNSDCFDINANEINFKLKLSYNDKLLYFEIEKVGEFPKNEYNKYFNLDEFGKMNRFFLQFETTIEIINSLISLIKNNNLSIIEENKGMKIQIQNPLIQKPIIIDVPIKEKNINFEINSIITYIISLSKKVEKMENELKNKSQLIEKKKMK